METSSNFLDVWSDLSSVGAEDEGILAALVQLITPMATWAEAASKLIGLVA